MSVCQSLSLRLMDPSFVPGSRCQAKSSRWKLDSQPVKSICFVQDLNWAVLVLDQNARYVFTPPDFKGPMFYPIFKSLCWMTNCSRAVSHTKGTKTTISPLLTAGMKDCLCIWLALCSRSRERMSVPFVTSWRDSFQTCVVYISLFMVVYFC